MEIRVASADDITVMVEWAACEGWNPGVADAACFRVADPQGFLIGVEGGEPAACISVVRYGGRFGFLGFYICRAEFRGRGFGLALWQAGLAHLAERAIGLDGVVAQQANYRKSGFALAHRNVRYAGTVTSVSSAAANIVAVTPEMAPAIQDFDAPIFGAPRVVFLNAWLGQTGHIARVYLAQGHVRGYAVLRPCREGFKLAPLFADSPDIAEALFGALAAEAGAAKLMLDLPEPNAAATALARRHGLTPVFETARMYRGSAPELPLEKIYGLTSFELG